MAYYGFLDYYYFVWQLFKNDIDFTGKFCFAILMTSRNKKSWKARVKMLCWLYTYVRGCINHQLEMSYPCSQFTYPPAFNPTQYNVYTITVRPPVYTCRYSPAQHLQYVMLTYRSHLERGPAEFVELKIWASSRELAWIWERSLGQSRHSNRAPSTSSSGPKSEPLVADSGQSST